MRGVCSAVEEVSQSLLCLQVDEADDRRHRPHIRAVRTKRSYRLSMKTFPVLVVAAVLAMAGCGGEDPDEAIDEADPGVEATIEPPAVEEPEVVGDDEAGGTLPDGVSQECFDALAAAGDETPVEGYGTDAEPLWPAFDACASVEEFSAATESVSGVLGEQDPVEYVTSLCGEVTEVQQSALCRDAEA